MTESRDISDIDIQTKVSAMHSALTYDAPLLVILIVLSFFVAILEGFGLSFLLPIVELAQGSSTTQPDSRYFQYFTDFYEFLGLPLTLETAVGGVILVLTARFVGAFAREYLRVSIENSYLRHLRQRAFSEALRADISYFDERGSDELLNAIITETEKASEFLKVSIQFSQQLLIALVYAGIAVYIEPRLTIASAVVLGLGAGMLRNRITAGYSIGQQLTQANELIQTAVQASLQGIRDVKLFTMSTEFEEQFDSAVSQYVDSSVKLGRNQAAMSNLYQLLSMVAVFLLVYLLLELTVLPLSVVGVYLLSIFRLAPRASLLNSHIYVLETRLPHLIKIQDLEKEMQSNREPDDGTKPVPEDISSVVFDDVSFSYEEGEPVLNGVSFEMSTDEFVAFVGQSGAGKSTIALLLARMYQPDSGEIRVNGTPIREFDLDGWRKRIAVVRQSPFIFNDTLRKNLTVGNRSASQADIDRVCEIAKVDEFRQELPDGYDTVLGDDGVRLSGGQRQRVALARALLKDADLLILDEATSDLDSDLEQQVQSSIEQMERNYGILTIAHRLSTVVNADQIYTVNDGTITEKGSHSALVDGDGEYAHLYDIQSSEGL
jgi:subfamily B ATP-binding cassette protein MsbA